MYYEMYQDRQYEWRWRFIVKIIDEDELEQEDIIARSTGSHETRKECRDEIKLIQSAQNAPIHTCRR